MCEAFEELGEDDSEGYRVCNCLHSFIACLFFQVFDFFAVVITFLVYYVVASFDGLYVEVTVPILALIISFCLYPLGPIGLLLQKGNLLVIYNIRLGAITLYAIAWMAYSLLVHKNTAGLVVCGVWSAAALFYLWGLFVTTKAIAYVNGHYRGYDDVDPDVAAKFEAELNAKMEEIKQREIEMDGEARRAEKKGEGKEKKEVNQDLPPSVK